MVRFYKAGLFALCTAPFAWVLYATLTNDLGPDPAERLMHITGEWALRMLILTLLISPLRKWKNWRWLLKCRRMLGLFTFFYACVHLLSFLQFFTGWDLTALLEELAERPYITVGFGAWLLMLPLAITSNRRMQRRLGRSWLVLHRLVYPATLLACLHLLWQARSDLGEALVYIIMFAGLLGWRVRRRLQKQRKTAITTA